MSLGSIVLPLVRVHYPLKLKSPIEKLMINLGFTVSISLGARYPLTRKSNPSAGGHITVA